MLTILSWELYYCSSLSVTPGASMLHIMLCVVIYIWASSSLLLILYLDINPKASKSWICDCSSIVYKVRGWYIQHPHSKPLCTFRISICTKRLVMSKCLWHIAGVDLGICGIGLRQVSLGVIRCHNNTHAKILLSTLKPSDTNNTNNIRRH